jgi:parallel beta-helix repeat protein
VYIAHGVDCVNARNNARVTILESWFEACGDFSGNAGGAVIRGEDAGLEVRDTLFFDNLVALYLQGNRSNAGISARQNMMNYNAYGAYIKGSSNPILAGNDISLNLTGLRALEQATPSVYNNYFEDNERQGLEVLDAATLTEFRHNNINNPEARLSGGFDLSYANSGVELQAIENYWGSSSEAEIETHIRHRPDDPTLGLVRFVPFSIYSFPVPESIGTAERWRWSSYFNPGFTKIRERSPSIHNRMRGMRGMR